MLCFLGEPGGVLCERKENGRKKIGNASPSNKKLKISR